MSASTISYTEADFEAARHAMVQTQLKPRGITHPAVLAAMAQVPRHSFMAAAIPELTPEVAYGDFPVEIGLGQTISQPYMVALMSQALITDTPRPGLTVAQPAGSVLEIGTGSGYQTAVLAQLFGQVYTIERFGDLSHRAAEVLQGLGYRNITLRVGDGSLGWPEACPFDAIILTAVAPRVPDPMMRQLAVAHGRLLLPMGEQLGNQQLIMMVRTPQTIARIDLGEVRFVPLVGEFGF